MSHSKQSRRARPGRGSRRASFSSPGSESIPSVPSLHVHHLRVQQALREHLAALLRDGLHDPHLEGLWLVALELSEDGRHARASVALEPRGASEAALTPEASQATDAVRAARVLPALARAGGFLRAALAQSLDLKRLPALRFTLVGVLPSTAAEGDASASPEAPAPEGGDA
ncbi:ribosome-binding factor A [Aggregicoccus sp. 17bor-14]|uniref:ribosome-binding factor A n=1 Tax=Myxococcaceae TaxID=31 RepID=UPI00129CE023|nr:MULTISPECIES: ribosome-binding factor A [Myxococcaceae]MBF5045394.1 ribosome-binding factor A [Simulacricoccus sp. 17bor-14]MRI91135.1 ribosome-binding factor A [Aggregicoccus sp. 17bor-14]